MRFRSDLGRLRRLIFEVGIPAPRGSLGAWWLGEKEAQTVLIANRESASTSGLQTILQDTTLTVREGNRRNSSLGGPQFPPSQ